MHTSHPNLSDHLSPAELSVLSRLDPAEVVSLLQALVRVRSDYPPGETRLVIAIVADKLRAAGVEFEIAGQSDIKLNLIARYPAGGGGPRLMFHAHLDTVGAGDRDQWRHDPYTGVIEGGSLFGRGAGDDKGSAAAQVMALVALARSGARLQGSVALAAVADVESGGLAGTRWLLESGRLQPDALVVGEQTTNRWVIAERVACGIDLTIFGRSAHGATPWEGDNAVLKAARVLNWLEARLLPALRQRAHPILPPASLNVGRITGGTQWNIVPPSCKVEMDRRLLPGETREAAIAEIRALLEV